ncbi:hypothetical protein [Paenibacillus dauci]|uniref:hypothetical protein n=1 Tax=Paenibacillus dauci TaxID=1567106 RepID=UPI0006197D96|nr:hypothetical protein [Paenibacillus dauci]
MHGLTWHYMRVTLLDSVITAAIFMLLDSGSEQLFDWQETIIFILVMAGVSYSFIIIGGIVVSSIIRLFTDNSWIIMVGFIIVASILYVLHLLSPSVYFLLGSANALIFGIFDALLSRNKNRITS